MAKLTGWKIGCLVVVLCAAVAHAAPTINLSKKIGPPTSEIIIWGHGFHPHYLVDIYFDTKDETPVLTNNEGEFQHAVIHAPRDAQPGEHWVTALERSGDKGDQKPFVVNTNWSQFHFSPDHAGVNPYENVLNVGNVHNLSLKWSYMTPYRVANSPAIKDGMVFVGTVAQVGYDGQQLYALNGNTGSLLWAFAVSGGGFSDPAVSEDVVYVGARTNLYALSKQTGTIVWNFQARNGVNTPAVAGGMVYTSSQDGNIYALDARTGSLVWQYAVGFYTTSSPTVANGVVYVGSWWQDTKGVYALDAKTGHLLWMYTADGTGATPTVSNGVLYVEGLQSFFALDAMTGGLLWSAPLLGSDSCPAVADGVVYMGAAADHNLYALSASTGAVLWQYATGGVVGSPAIAGGVIYVGSYDDDLYVLNAQTGSLLWMYVTGGPLEDAQAPAIANGTLYFGSDDGNVYAFGLGVADAGNSVERPDFKTLQPSPALKPSSALLTHE